MRKTVVQMVAVGVVASAIGIVLGFEIHWFPVAASEEAHKVDTLYHVLVIASVPMFVLVAVVVLFSAIRFRQRPGQERQDGPPIHGNTRLEVLWTTIPALLLISLSTYSYVVLHDTEKKQADRMVVDVVGQQFAWSYAYPAADGKQIKTTQLYLPAGRQVEFRMQSLDVIHDFWVPEFRIKSDLVPGIKTSYVITPDRIGSYPVVCAELCGLGHATMRSTVHVVAPATFEQWLARQPTSDETGTATTASAGGTS